MKLTNIKFKDYSCGTGVWTQGLYLEPFYQSFFIVGFFRDRVSNYLPEAGFKLQSSWSQLLESLVFQAWPLTPGLKDLLFTKMYIYHLASAINILLKFFIIYYPSLHAFIFSCDFLRVMGETNNIYSRINRSYLGLFQAHLLYGLPKNNLPTTVVSTW
jgi:hypothetical protein